MHLLAQFYILVRMKHFTASAYIFHEKKVLLIHHKKVRKWFGPGGHVDENELPHEAAIREAREETGLEIELMHDESVWITPQFNGKSVPRPAFMLLEKIPPYKEQKEHFHIDCVYRARPFGGEMIQHPEELLGMGWFSLEETASLEMFQETRDVLAQLFPLHLECAQTRTYSAQDDAPLPPSPQPSPDHMPAV